MGAVYTQLSLRERRRIEDWWHANVPVREMARVLRRSKATIHREIKRNFWADDALPRKYAGYFGSAAHLQSQRRRSVQRKLIRHPELCKSVVARIRQGWTPEQIGNRMIYEGAKLRVCQETIYRYIYSKEGMAQELWWYLPEHRKSGSAPGGGVGTGVHLLLHGWCCSFTGRRSSSPYRDRCTPQSTFPPACSGARRSTHHFAPA